MAGRTTLLKYVLASIPLYYLSCIHVPATAVNRLEREYRAFLWSYNVDKRDLHLVAWEKLCMPQHYGGLNLIPLHVKE